MFNPQGTRVITASRDKTVKVWDTVEKKCIQTFSDFQNDVFSCSFNYYGDMIITGKKKK